MSATESIRPVVVARLHEVALKGRNRQRFVHLLTGNIAYALRGTPYQGLRIRSGRILVELCELSDWPLVRDRIVRVFGIENLSLTLETGTALDALREGVARLIELEGGPPGSYRVRVKRSDKTYPLPSPEVEREIGGFIQDQTAAPVQLRGAGTVYQIEILPQAAYVSSRVLRGPGGLPVGVSGRVVALLSGGYDSPVAARRMLRRGCTVTLVHCHAYPFVRPTSIEKVVEIVQQIGEAQPGIELMVVPIGEAQRAIALASPPPLRVILYRRLMLRIAAAIARERCAGAIVTGESLGQVASQTLENLRTIEAAIDQFPVFRPLIGMDKDEILAEAARIGTEPISRVPDDDCCTVFLPRHPATYSTPEDAAAAESGLDLAQLVNDALARRTVYAGQPSEWDAAEALLAPFPGADLAGALQQSGAG